MANEVELQRMVTRFTGDASSYQGAVRQVERATYTASESMKHSVNNAKVFGSTIDHLGTQMSNFAGSMRAMAALESPWQVLTRGVQLAAASERAQSDFGVMLRDVQKGKDLVKDLQRFAADTPLNIGELQAVSRTLLQYKVSQEELLPLMKQLGDAAMGDADKFKRLALAFGQMNNANRVTNEELGQMREAGFYPLAEMARIAGKDVGVMFDEISKGNVPMRVLRQALAEATGAGGQFNDGMKQASLTLGGLFSTMGDDIDEVQRTIGTMVVAEFKLKEAVQGVSRAAQATTAFLAGMSPAVKTAAASVAILAASFGTLIVVWKVAALSSGIVVGVLKDVVITTKSAALATWEYAAALTAKNAVTVQAAGVEGMLGMRVASTTGAVRAATATVVLFKAALVAAVVYGMAQLLEMLPAMRRKTQEAADELASLNALLAETSKFSADAATRATDAVNAADPSGRAAAIAASSAEIQRRIDEQRQLLEVYAQAREEISGSLAGILSHVAPVQTDSDRELARLRALTDGATAQLATLQAALDRLNAAKRDNDAGVVDPGTKKSFSEFSAELERQFRTFGMTTDQAKLYEFELRGVKGSELETARAMIEANRVLKERADLMKSVSDLTASMERELATAGMSGDEAKLYELRLRGATEAQLANARGLAAMRAELERVNKLQEEGRRVTEELRTPTEQYEQRIAQLNKLLAEHAISRETYERGVQGAADNLLKVQEAANSTGTAVKEMNRAVEMPDAALRNSAEAMSRITAFREANQRNPDSTGPDWRAFGTRQQQEAQTARQQLAETKAMRKALDRAARQSQGAYIAPSNVGVA